jgi:hypothetical protein
MTNFAERELELMARARAALEPEPEDRERLRHALAANILAAGAVAGTVSIANLRSLHPVRHLLHSHLAALGTLAAVVGTLAFAGGYCVGHRTRNMVVKTVTIVQPAPVVSGVNAAPAAPEPLNLTSLAVPLDLGHSVARPRVAASVTPSPSIEVNSLSEELELLRRAERTIRTGNAQVALGLLEEMDEKFPRGQLLEERTAARVMARCQLEDEAGARARGNSYLISHSQSVYADRVRSLCHLDSKATAKESPKGGDL